MVQRRQRRELGRAARDGGPLRAALRGAGGVLENLVGPAAAARRGPANAEQGPSWARRAPAAARGPARRAPRRRWVSWPLILAGVALVVASGFRLAVPAIRQAEAPHGRALPPPPARAATAVPGPATPSVSAPPPPPVTSPSRLKIPAIAVDAPIVNLGLTVDKAIDVPTRWGDVGWYKDGPAPGGVGPAVFVGHYDSKSGPAVFYRLSALLPGDQVQVVGAYGRVATFVVDRLQEVSKAAFPSGEVYGPVTRPEIRLITCDGAFDEKTHHYVDNLVVYGHAVGLVAPPGPSAAPAAGSAPPAAAVPAGPATPHAPARAPAPVLRRVPLPAAVAAG